MSFITEWIRNGIELQQEATEREVRMMRSQQAGAKLLRVSFDEPFRGPGFWRNPMHYVTVDQQRLGGGSDGKQGVYMATATKRANSYDALLDIYGSLQRRKEARLAAADEEDDE